MSRRGWCLARAATLAAASVLLAPVNPLVLVGIPAALLLLAFRRDDILVLGGAALLLLLAFAAPPPSPGALWYAERGWALVLGGAFVAVSVLREGAALLSRALAALGAASGFVAVTAILRPGLAGELEWHVGRQLLGAAETTGGLVGLLAGAGETDPWPTVYRVVDLQMSFYPALVALASLAALAVGWFVLGRLSGPDEVLGPFRELRFNDELVWVLAAGLALLVLPPGGWVARVGENAVFFMGGLYLLRGFAILLWVAAAMVTSAWTGVLWGVAAGLLYPVVVVAALLLGLGDTWLDVRERLRRAGTAPD